MNVEGHRPPPFVFTFNFKRPHSDDGSCYCSKCGAKKNEDGWCRWHCTDDEPSIEHATIL